MGVDYAIVSGCRKQISLNGFVASITQLLAIWVSAGGDVGLLRKPFRWGGAALRRSRKPREYPIGPSAMGFEKSMREARLSRIGSDNPAVDVGRWSANSRN